MYERAVTSHSGHGAAWLRANRRARHDATRSAGRRLQASNLSAECGPSPPPVWLVARGSQAVQLRGASMRRQARRHDSETTHAHAGAGAGFRPQHGSFSRHASAALAAPWGVSYVGLSLSSSCLKRSASFITAAWQTAPAAAARVPPERPARAAAPPTASAPPRQSGGPAPWRTGRGRSPAAAQPRQQAWPPQTQ